MPYTRKPSTLNPKPWARLGLWFGAFGELRRGVWGLRLVLKFGFRVEGFRFGPGGCNASAVNMGCVETRNPGVARVLRFTMTFFAFLEQEPAVGFGFVVLLRQDLRFRV